MIETLTFQIPPSLNAQINKARANRFLAAKEKKALTLKIKRWCEMQGCQKFPGKVWVSISWQIKSFANDPVDNLPASLKGILDGMVLAGVLTKDSAMVIQSPIVHHVSHGNNTVTIEVCDRPIWKLERIA